MAYNLTANISRDMFSYPSNYKRVKIEQGVPYIDANHNLIGEIAAWRDEQIIMQFIGSGFNPASSPNVFLIDGSNSYNNDFAVGGPGILFLADAIKGGVLPPGWIIYSPGGFKYSTQTIPTYEGTTITAPAGLTTPNANRTDTVWLEAWSQDYGPLDDSTLAFENPQTSSALDTCHCEKIITLVQVWEGSGVYSSLGSTAIAGAPFYNAAHTYYPLAQIVRLANNSQITSAMLTDLRPRVSHAF